MTSHPPATSCSARTIAAVLFAAGVVLFAGCTSSDGGDDSTFRDPGGPTGELRLVSFDSCDEAIDQLRAAAGGYVGPYGFSTGSSIDLDAADGAAEAAPDTARGAAPAAPAEPGALEAPGAPAAPDAPDAPSYSGTNVHEAGVDEPDLVKTDGRRIVVVSQGRLRVVDAASRVEIGALNLIPDEFSGEPVPWVVADLLLAGDHALVLVEGSYGWPEPGLRGTEPVEPAEPAGPVAPDVQPDVPPEPDLPVAPDAEVSPELSPVPAPIMGPQLLLVDLTGTPRILSEYTMDGSLVDARAVGSTARVVVRSAPQLEFPRDPNASEQESLAANREVVASAELSDFLPRYEVTTGGEVATGQVDCTSMSRPATYTATSMLTVLTFDLAAPELGDGAPVTVVADGDTVYSNGPGLYVATDLRWRIGPTPLGPVPDVDADVETTEVEDGTEIYKFDTSQPGPPRYVASGKVDGWLINQYAMSEWDGHLRVATTDGESWWNEESDSESTVYVLAERDGALVETGSVGGLGKGERIYSVRFTGPVGYVVTFRETDPLYTVGLSDPANPVLLGELHVTGYSAYLHPIDEGRLIGVGQEADEQGRTEGTQVSLFDVSDLADPQVLARHHVQYGYSEAEFDPHAFLWWPDRRLLVLPLTDYSGSSGALVLRVDEGGFTELGQVSHPISTIGWEGGGHIVRSLVVDDTLWTVSDTGLAAHDLSTLNSVAWIPF
jgi:uncharacterized secreted protein with C-terminal beta-propeller domain